MIKKPTLALVAIGAGLIFNSAVQAASDIPTTPTSPSETTAASSGTNTAVPTTGSASSTVNTVSPPANGSTTETTSTGADANATKTDADNKNVNLPPNIADKIKTLNSNSPDFKPNTNTKEQSTSASQ
jgi:hypothetical protein